MYIDEGSPETSKAHEMLSEGVDVNEQDDFGWTALQLAAVYGRKEIADVLLANNADPNIRNSVGRTALMYAARPRQDINSKIAVGSSSRYQFRFP